MSKYSGSGISNQMAFLAVTKLLHPEDWSKQDQKELDHLQDLQWEWEQEQCEDYWDHNDEREED